MARPVVGITTYLLAGEVRRLGDGVGARAGRLRPRGRARRRAAAARAAVDDGVEETLDALDGLVFSGGSDIDPELLRPRAASGDRRGPRSATTPSSRCCRRRSRATCRCSRSAAARRC